MKNNDILRRLRYAFDFGDDKMMKIFSMGGFEVNRADLSDYLKKKKMKSISRSTTGFLLTILTDLS